MKKIPLLLALILTLSSLSACERDTTYDAFASCIANSGTNFYGAFWCHNCQNQKKLFGDSKDLLPYIECDPNGKNVNLQACTLNKVESYPTWVFKDGSRRVGTTPLAELSERTGCPLPNTSEDSTSNSSTPATPTDNNTDNASRE